MTITFPRSFPSGLDNFANCEFSLVRSEAINPTYGGQLTGMELADAVWSAKYQSGILDINGADRATWQAWALSLRGVLNAFYAYDPEKRYPFFYGPSVLGLTRYGGGSFAGDPTVVSTTASSISLSALPAAYQFTVGDHISIPMTAGLRALYQVVESAIADSIGTATVTVEPNVRTGAATTANAVQLVTPTCVMVLKPGTFSAPAQGGTPQGVTFEAVQKLA